MTERIIDGRPKLPAPEERLALPAPEQDGATDDPAPERPWYRRRRFWIAVAALAAIFAAIWMFGSGGEAEKKGEEGGRPPAAVNVTRARQVEWAAEIPAIGTLVAIQGVDVTTELAGNVAAIRFVNGTRARAGQTLVQLDTTTERAQLRALMAQRDQARLAAERARRLIQRGAIAEAEVETAQATFESLQAQVEETRTIIEKKRIDAPFSGYLGIRRVNLGQYVAPGTAIVSLQQIAPIFVNFELPENSFARVRTGQQVRLRVDAFAGRSFEGRINAINPQVATATRNFTVQATIPNRDRALRPGMFADVTVLLPGSRTVTVVPATAVTTNAYGETVFLAQRPDPRREAEKQQRAQQAEDEQGGFFARLFGGGGSESGGASASADETKKGAEKGKAQPQSRYVARTQFIRTGERRGLEIEVVRGLRPGTPVVTSGQLKLEDDAPITIARGNPDRGANPAPQTP